MTIFTSLSCSLFQDQKAFLEEGFEKKAQEMRGEIQRLRHNIEDMEQNIGFFVNLLVTGLATVTFGPVVLVAEAVRGIASLLK